MAAMLKRISAVLERQVSNHNIGKSRAGKGYTANV
jgi:hypothetical protein